VTLTPKKKLELATRREQVCSMFLAGVSKSNIARRLKIARPTVYDDIDISMKELNSQRLRDIELIQTRELEVLDWTERQARKAWKRSQEDAETVTKNEGGGPNTVTGSTTTKGQVGDSRFLTEVIRCSESRRKMIGADAPEKHEHGGQDGGPVIREVVVKSREDLKRLISFRQLMTESKENGNGNGE